jgi:hypothetical protein
MRSIRAALLAFTVCATVMAPGHTAGNYRQPVWFQWIKADLDVLVVPAEHGQIFNGNGLLNGANPAEVDPLNNSYTRAMMDSIADWKRAINAYAPAWLKNGLHIRVKLLGRDSVTPDDLRNWEILVASDPDKTFILGMATTISAAKCVVDNSKFFITSMTYEDMFDINAQEYGHCLGLSHVNEASPPNPVNDDINHDPMNGAYPNTPGAAGNPIHCVSNLNVAGLEEVYSSVLGQGPGAANGVIAQSDYTRISSCAAA